MLALMAITGQSRRWSCAEEHPMTHSKTQSARTRWLAPLVGAVGAGAAYALATRPWHLRWGATAEEAITPLAGDDLVPNAAYVTTRATTIQVPPGAVWPWLVQMG